jgi:hypothetical protein
MPCFCALYRVVPPGSSGKVSRVERYKQEAMIALIQRLKALEELARLHHLESKSHLSHHELHQRDRCIARLIAIGAPAVPGLVRELGDVEFTDPSAAVPMILQKIGDPAVPCLARAMHAGDSRLRQNAIALLGRIATPSAVSELDDETVDLMDQDAVRTALIDARHPSRRGIPTHS